MVRLASNRSEKGSLEALENKGARGEGSGFILEPVEKIDCDSIELNSFQQDFDEDTLGGYYTQGFVEIGFVNLFAAAFPLGPLIAVISNVVDIWSKIYVFLNVYKRPEAQRCTGIGYWISVWEVFNVLSIFSNLALFYDHHNDAYTILK